MELQRQHPRIRRGKTAKDLASGATARRLSNRDQRAAYDNDNNPLKIFPYLTCNGKKNRSRYTGKNGATIFTH